MMIYLMVIIIIILLSVFCALSISFGLKAQTTTGPDQNDWPCTFTYLEELGAIRPVNCKFPANNDRNVD